VTKLTPFPAEYPAEGVKVIDLETRSLLQVLYFVSHGVEVPAEHFARGLARPTLEADGSVFDYDRVLGGLFKVKAVKCKHRPEDAAVAVCYLDHWYYVDATDHDSRATFALAGASVEAGGGGEGRCVAGADAAGGRPLNRPDGGESCAATSSVCAGRWRWRAAR